MDLKQILEEIDRLKAELDKLLPMKKEWQDQLDKKFRLEWSYNSNHIEGNTLTYGETELLLIFGKTTGDHDIREYNEMTAHDVAVSMVYEYAKDTERPLNETFIKQLNEIILVKPFWKESITPDGQPTRRLIEIGKYKSHPNSVRLENGEIFHYASPEEVPAKMDELMQFYQRNAISTDVHKVWLAAMLHYELVRIHPFDDGNGRTSRLVMNYVLIKNGLPPIIIKSVEKKKYLDALNKADTGNKEAFVHYIAMELIWSLNKSISAAKGENIEDEDDLKKEIALMDREFSNVKKINLSRSSDILQKLFRSDIKATFQRIFDELTQVRSWFFEVHFFIHPGGRGYLMNKSIDAFWESLADPALFQSEFYTAEIGIRLEGFRSGGPNAFTFQENLKFDFDQYSYIIRLGNNEILLRKTYDDEITEPEQKLLTRKFVANVVKRINQHRSQK